MKQTTKYGFNLVERDDTFSPDPLNENMEKAESALSGLASTSDGLRVDLEAKTAALDMRVAELEGYKIVTGVYKGAVFGAGGERQFISLGGTPLAVWVEGPDYASVSTPESPRSNLKIEEGGFSVYNPGANSDLNQSRYYYPYAAIIKITPTAEAAGVIFCLYALRFFMKNRKPSINTAPMGRAISPGAPANASTPAIR